VSEADRSRVRSRLFWVSLSVAVLVLAVLLVGGLTNPSKEQHVDAYMDAWFAGGDPPTRADVMSDLTYHWWFVFSYCTDRRDPELWETTGYLGKVRVYIHWVH